MNDARNIEDVADRYFRVLRFNWTWLCFLIVFSATATGTFYKVGKKVLMYFYEVGIIMMIWYIIHKNTIEDQDQERSKKYSICRRTWRVSETSKCTSKSPWNLKMSRSVFSRSLQIIIIIQTKKNPSKKGISVNSFFYCMPRCRNIKIHVCLGTVVNVQLRVYKNLKFLV